MSILSKTNSFNMATPSFFDLKKQASFFIKEKIKTARLAFTDVTPAQLMTEEATNENSWAPNTQTLGFISKAAFNLDDYWRTVDILHKRLARFERKNWRVSYNSLIVLEHLLTHGPESVAEEFQCDRDVITQMEAFQYIDEKGFNWGLAVRRKSEKVLKLLEKGPLLKAERNRARQLSRGIQGFGSFNLKPSSSGQAILQESSFYRKCNSNFNEHENEQNQTVSRDECNLTDKKPQEELKFEGPKTVKKENMVPENDDLRDDKSYGEMNPLLGNMKDQKRDGDYLEEEENHPFNDMEKQSVVSLLTQTDGSL